VDQQYDYCGLGLSEDQRARIGRAFDTHSRTIINNTSMLEKEETQLARLLEAESLDRGAVLSQTNRVIQARSEVERETAVMTLEMREQLSRPQWMKLQEMQAQLNTVRSVIRQPTPAPATAPALPGQRRQ
jgi:Spy/CpxP family protein refolding chaperone